MFCCWFGLFLIKVVASSNVTLQASERIQALTNDVSVVVNGAQSGDIIELFYENGVSPLSGQIVAGASYEGRVVLVFDCGYFSRLGDYTFVLKRRDPDHGNEESVSLAETIVSAIEWPNIKVRMKSQHEVHSGDVKVIIETSRDICRSDVAADVEITLLLLREDAFVMAAHRMSFPPTSSFFDCEAFSRSGSYVTQLRRSVSGENSVMAASDVMFVHWSSDYSLKVPDVLFPCRENIKIKVGKPPCASPGDIIEVRGTFNNGSSFVITSAKIGSANSLEFSCAGLPKSTPGLCFRYVISNKTVSLVCRPLSGEDFNVAGGWSYWSHWGTCNRSCVAPKKQRIRTCDNPIQRGNGPPCSDEGSFREHQVVRTNDPEKCPHIASLPVVSPNCNCGCLMPVLQDQLLVSPTSGECSDQRVLRWKLSLPLSKILRLSLIDFQFLPAEALMVENPPTTFTMTSRVVIIQSNTASLRYLRSYHDVSSCGFVLLLEVLDPRPTPSAFPPTSHNNDTTSWFDTLVHNPVATIAVSICLLVAVVALTVSVCRCREQHRKKRHENTTISLENRLTAPPDGKSSSNIDTESDPPLTVGVANLITPKPPRAAYYLAQRQLQIMKKDGRENSLQMYASSCLNNENIHDQEALLFGRLKTQSDENT